MSGTRLLTIAAFVLTGLIIGVLEWTARRDGSRIPTLAQMYATVLSADTGRLPVRRLAVLVLWWWLGWHFLAR